MKQRKVFRPDVKVLILKKNLVEGVAISDLCDQYGFHPTVFYRWQKAFFENGIRAFEKEENLHVIKLEKEVTRLKEKLSKKNEVLSELMEEHVNLKKNLGGI